MRFEDSKYSQDLDYTTLTLDTGVFYLTDKYVVAELYEGIHFDLEKTQQLADELLNHYEVNSCIGYISNRINSYSIEPQIWTEFTEEFNFIIASALVTYNDISYINASIEKRFSSKSLKRCENLHQAIDWITNLKEITS